MNIETIPFQGWANCLRLSTPSVELIATTDVGPRLLHFSRPGGENQLRIFSETAGQTGGSEFRLYGGHRFWIAPEAMPRTYYPDNFPVTVEDHCSFVRLIAPPESTGIQKELDIVLDESQAAAVIVHRARNTGLWPIELSPWAITLMELGGVAILPLPPRGSHASGDLLPAASLSVWSYTDLSDPRFTFTPGAILLRHEGGQAEPQKIGLANRRGWVAHYRASELFVKHFSPVPGATYPDLGCSTEVFTRHDMLELETLAPLCVLPPGETVEYRERWSLHACDDPQQPGVLDKLLDTL